MLNDFKFPLTFLQNVNFPRLKIKFPGFSLTISWPVATNPDPSFKFEQRRSLHTCVWERRSVEYPNMSFNGTWKDKRELWVNEKINYVYSYTYKTHQYLDWTSLIINVSRQSTIFHFTLSRVIAPIVTPIKVTKSKLKFLRDKGR